MPAQTVRAVGKRLAHTGDLISPCFASNLQERLTHAKKTTSDKRIGSEKPSGRIHWNSPVQSRDTLLNEASAGSCRTESQLLHPKDLVKRRHVADFRDIYFAHRIVNPGSLVGHSSSLGQCSA